MVSFLIEDKDKGIETNYWVDLEGVSLDFDSTWMRSEAEICTKANLGEWSDEVEGCIRWVGPRSLEWVPSTDCIINEGENILVGYGEGYYGPLHTSVIAGWEDVKALAEGAEYQHGSARLEIKRDFRFGASTVRLIVRRTAVYLRVPLFKLSIVIEDIRRDEWNKLLRYQQSFKNGRLDSIVRDVRLAWRGNECVIEETPESPWQSNQNDVTNAVRHVALEALPLVLKYRNAQKEAAQRGLSLDDFQWEFPNHHEACIMRRPSSQTDTPLRALRLDLSISASMYISNAAVDFFIDYIELQITTITRSPSLPNNFSSCTLRLDPHYAALANATIRNHSPQIIEISPDSQPANRVITTSGSIHVNGPLQIMGSVMGDMFAAPIYGGIVGGQNNTNHLTAPLTAEAVASAVVRALDPRPCDGGRLVPQTGAGRKRKRDDEEDVEGPSRRQFRPMSIISSFCAALFSA